MSIKFLKRAIAIVLFLVPVLSFGATETIDELKIKEKIVFNDGSEQSSAFTTNLSLSITSISNDLDTLQGDYSFSSNILTTLKGDFDSLSNQVSTLQGDYSYSSNILTTLKLDFDAVSNSVLTLWGCYNFSSNQLNSLVPSFNFVSNNYRVLNSVIANDTTNFGVSNFELRVSTDIDSILTVSHELQDGKSIVTISNTPISDFSLTVGGTIFGTSTETNYTDITKISFDGGSGLYITNLLSGEVLVKLGSYWSTLYPDDGLAYSPTGEQPLQIKMNTNLAATGTTIDTNTTPWTLYIPRSKGFPLTENGNLASFSLTNGYNIQATNGYFGTLTVSGPTTLNSVTGGVAKFGNTTIYGDLWVTGITYQVEVISISTQVNIGTYTNYITTNVYSTQTVYQVTYVYTNIVTTNNIDTYVNVGGNFDASLAAWVKLPHLHDTAAGGIVASGTVDLTNANLLINTENTETTSNGVFFTSEGLKAYFRTNYQAPFTVSFTEGTSNYFSFVDDVLSLYIKTNASIPTYTVSVNTTNTTNNVTLENDIFTYFFKTNYQSPLSVNYTLAGSNYFVLSDDTLSAYFDTNYQRPFTVSLTETTSNYFGLDGDTLTMYIKTYDLSSLSNSFNTYSNNAKYASRTPLNATITTNCVFLYLSNSYYKVSNGVVDGIVCWNVEMPPLGQGALWKVDFYFDEGYAFAWLGTGCTNLAVPTATTNLSYIFEVIAGTDYIVGY